MRLDRDRPARRSGERRRHPWCAPVAGAIATALLLTGCASTSDQVTDAVDQSVAALATARLALDLDAGERIFRTTSTTAVEDARREAVDAARTVGQLDAADETEAGRRAEALDALDDAVRSLDAAADALGGVGDLGDAAQRVADAEEALRALTREGRP
ncbi:hypothetical protein ACFPER_05760 [Agromyces aurantiacus]|uniref:DUF4398 domain-containing protein n=1 Tax=Agromyces aurantiacus TaxID=165814 RepID=A0ABV9R3T4_9MICO|nr:hypothetical protein [Agromyces aurantiacus]MBM7502964.1 stage V sporulation protein SpoVS [Agromyces aurantiacus]